MDRDDLYAFGQGAGALGLVLLMPMLVYLAIGGTYDGVWKATFCLFLAICMAGGVLVVIYDRDG